jgi:1-acyl-sn-glycerol-3-phosphate acyltransferase
VAVSESAYIVAAPDCSSRRNVAYWIARAIVLSAHRLLVRPHIDMHEDVVAMKRRGGAAYVYCGLHKSLWETTGVLPPLHHAGLPIPYLAMGDNLIKGRLFQALSKQIGAFLVRRPSNRSEVAASARRLRDDVLSFIAFGHDVMMFPEGTRTSIPRHGRYGVFFPAAFEAALEYQRNSDAIVATNPDVIARETFIVPFNVDYSRLREANELIGGKVDNPRTLRVFDSLSMITNIGDTYLSYGQPIRVADHLDLDRKRLAALCRQRCLDLVKILPVNVASCAILGLEADASASPSTLAGAVRRVVDSLRPYAERFRGFSPDDDGAEIVRRARRAHLDFRSVLSTTKPLYELYASFIGHYRPAQN